MLSISLLLFLAIFSIFPSLPPLCQSAVLNVWEEREDGRWSCIFLSFLYSYTQQTLGKHGKQMEEQTVFFLRCSHPTRRISIVAHISLLVVDLFHFSLRVLTAVFLHKGQSASLSRCSCFLGKLYPAPSFSTLLPSLILFCFFQ